MGYSIVQPPFTLRFREMSMAELRGYSEWFMNTLPERVTVLKAEVRRSPSHAVWVVDYSPESLEGLGDWFAGQVETRAKTQVEIDEVEAKLTFPIEVSGEPLTNRTLSLAMDIGMYFGQVIVNNLAATKWDQPLRNKKFADYGQPVIMGFGTVPLNPVRIVVMLAYGIARKKQGGRRLRELYDTWANMRRT
jgi:hypothetical protein